VVAHLADTEAQLKRTVNPALYMPADFGRKLAGDNAFLSKVLGQPKIFLIGTEDGLPKSGKPG
jgi:hypothetical protein